MKKGAKPEISIVLPYLSWSGCINLCKECLEQNSTATYEFCEVIDSTDVYNAYNRGAEMAKSPTLVFLNDDMFVAPGWDRCLLSAVNQQTIVTPYLVESGRLPVNHRNIERFFGYDPASFDREGFEAFAEQHARTMPEAKVGFGWYMPFAVRKSDFLPFPERGNFITSDALIFGKYASNGYRFIRARSYAYHFQRMSS